MAKELEKMNNVMSLADMKAGQVCKVVQVYGGCGIQRRLQALGIRPGVSVTKVSEAFRPGAVVVAAGGGQSALGYGVARKVMVEGCA